MKNYLYLYLFLYLIVINVIGFFAMFLDKQKAINGRWRIKEMTLMIISIIGGSIGMILGMYRFRHKTKKLYFKLGIPIIVFFQIYITIILVKLIRGT